MKLGVYDFLEKPVDLNVLLGDVQEALAIDAASRARAMVGASVQRRIDLLTDRECEVLRLLCEGKSSRQMSAILNISVKTVAIHRWHMMKKMQAASATEAIHLVRQARAADPSTLSNSSASAVN
jgi:FixJ family two-component response regulator